MNWWLASGCFFAISLSMIVGFIACACLTVAKQADERGAETRKDDGGHVG